MVRAKGPAAIAVAITFQGTLPFAGLGVPDEGCTDSASHLGGGPRTVVDMDNRAEVREFLMSRRAKLTPQQAGLPDSATAGSRDCAAARSRRWPASASSTTASSNAADSPVSRPRSSMPSPGRYNSTTPNGLTCSTSRTPPTAPAQACAHEDAQPSAGLRGRVCSGPSTSSLPRPSSATAGWTCWPSTISDVACIRRCTTAIPPGPRTSRAYLPARGFAPLLPALGRGR